MILLLTSALLLSVAHQATGAFDVYWNSQSDRCKNQFNVDVDFAQFGIIHNTGRVFYGDQVNILYGPGKFPTISDNNEFVNGGIPQKGNIADHILEFLSQLETTTPLAYQGPLVLDFEVYKPGYNVAPSRYRTQSVSELSSQYPSWTTAQLEEEAELLFNASSAEYFRTLLDAAAINRPNTLVGYYHYPYCSNGVAPCDQCKQSMIDLNNELDWMYEASSALYPSLYTHEFGDVADYRTNVMSTRMKETNRINAQNLPVLPYIYYRYKDTNNKVVKSVIINTLWTIKYYGGSGTVVWAAWADYGSQALCDEFKDYFDNVLGPLLQCFKDMPDDIANVLKYRYPLYADEAGLIDPSTLTQAAIDKVDEMEAKSKVDTSSDDHMWVTRRVISMYCRNQ